MVQVIEPDDDATSVGSVSSVQNSGPASTSPVCEPSTCGSVAELKPQRMPDGLGAAYATGANDSMVPATRPAMRSFFTALFLLLPGRQLSSGDDVGSAARGWAWHGGGLCGRPRPGRAWCG